MAVDEAYEAPLWPTPLLSVDSSKEDPNFYVRGTHHIIMHWAMEGGSGGGVGFWGWGGVEG